MTDSATTPFSNKCDILAELWTEYKNDSQFQDFFDYNDLGLPLAYAISTQVISSTKLAENFVGETFDLFLDVLGIQEDTGFETLADVLMLASN
jgi:hypothetical protein